MRLPESGLLRNIGFAALIGMIWPVGLMLMNHELIAAPGWFEGLGSGLVLAWCWSRSPGFRKIAGVAAVVLLIAIVAGEVKSLGMQPRAMFQGLSLGFPYGLLGLALVDLRRAHAWLEGMCRDYADEPGLRWLREHTPRTKG